MVEVKIITRRGKPFATVNVPENATLDDLKKAVLNAKGLNENRQLFNEYKLENQKVVVGKVLSDGPLNLKNGATFAIKDLGPQISWRGVFIVEYFGPLIAFPLFYLLRPIIYGVTNEESPLQLTQKIAFALFVLHFFKREFETIFIHKFSKGTMPVFNLFKNSGYYWAYAFLNAYFVLHPKFTSPPFEWVVVGAIIFVIGLIGTFWCHIILSNLRPAGTTVRKIPRGFLFEYVSCPNYTMEILEWIGFTIMVSSVAALLFTITGAGQMWVWAIGKHKRYKQEFDGKEGRELYPRRKILIPFLL